jgi:hypothetical protein
MSKPLDVPSVEEEEWNMGEILDKVFAYGVAPGGPGGSTAAAAAGGAGVNGSAAAAGDGAAGAPRRRSRGLAVALSPPAEPLSPLSPLRRSASSPPVPPSFVSERTAVLEAAALSAKGSSDAKVAAIKTLTTARKAPTLDEGGAVAGGAAGGELADLPDGALGAGGEDPRASVVASYWAEDAEPAAVGGREADAQRDARRAQQASQTLARTQRKASTFFCCCVFILKSQLEGHACAHAQTLTALEKRRLPAAFLFCFSIWKSSPHAAGHTRVDQRLPLQVALQRQAEDAAAEKLRVEQILDQMRRRNAPASQPSAAGPRSGGKAGGGENGGDDCVVS